MGEPRPCSVLITGAQGFLGRYITAACADVIERVAAVDRCAPVAPAPGNVHAFVSDICDGSFAEILRETKPDVLVHAAGPASVGASMEDPSADFRGALNPWLEVLEAVRRERSAARLVLLSSAAVYGQPEALPVREDSALRPISPYGYHKRMAEEMLREYHAVYGLQGCILRIFSAYGEGLERQVLHDICRKALRESAVELFGTGEETRDFVHARDVASAVLSVARQGDFNAAVYNVASGTETTIAGLARMVLGALGSAKPLRFSGQQRGGDPLRWRADIARLSALGFRCETELRDGVKQYAAWVKSGDRARDRARGT